MFITCRSLPCSTEKCLLLKTSDNVWHFFFRQAHLNLLVTDDPSLVEEDRRLLYTHTNQALEPHKQQIMVVLNKVG